MTTLRPYLEYKPSDVEWLGDIPSDWQTVKIKRIARSGSGGTPPMEQRDYWIPEIPWVSSKDMKRSRIDDSQMWISQSAIDDGKSGLAPERSVLMVVRSGILRHTIPVAVAIRDVAYNQDLKAFQLDQQSVTSEFFTYLIQGKQSELLTLWSKQGATVESLEFPWILETAIPLPPLDEQRAIADFLDAMDARITRFIDARRRMIGLLEEQKQAVITQAVTKGLDPDVPMKPSGIDWLGDIPAHWEVQRFKHLAWINSGQVDPRDERYQSEILIAPNHIAKGTGQLLELETAAAQGADSGKYIVKKGQVVYSKIRPYLRKAAIAPFDCLCSADMYPISPKPALVLPEFFLRALLGPTSTRYIVDSSLRARMPKVNRESLGELWMPYPSLHEQRQIVTHIHLEAGRIDTAISRYAREIDLIQEYRTRLVSDVVTGKLDARGVELGELPDFEEIPEADEPDDDNDDVPSGNGDVHDDT